MLSWLERFWTHVEVRGPDECWPWLLAPALGGYGQFSFSRPDGRVITMRAHVLALILLTGEDADGRYGLHGCDNPPCCNVGPGHAHWGTAAQNVAERVERGRSARQAGSSHGRSSLTEEQVLAMRELFRSGMRQAEIARRFSVSPGVVYKVVHRKGWTHV